MLDLYVRACEGGSDAAVAAVGDALSGALQRHRK